MTAAAGKTLEVGGFIGVSGFWKSLWSARPKYGEISIEPRCSSARNHKKVADSGLKTPHSLRGVGQVEGLCERPENSSYMFLKIPVIFRYMSG